MRRGSEWRRLRILPTNRDVLIVMVLLLLIVANASVRGTIARHHHLSKIEFSYDLFRVDHNGIPILCGVTR